MNDAVIQLNNLVKRFAGMDKPAVAPLNCTIRKGYVTGLVGPDGAGKTTLMRMLAGLLKPDEGSASVLGLDPIEDDGALHAMLGYMPQKFGLYEDLTVMENLNLYADLRSVTGETRQKTFSLGPFTDRLAGKLSGGMKQKLGLACTLVGEPKVLLLDEPGVGVDPISRRELWQMVHELAGDGMLILWSTSYLDEAEQCRDVLLMNEGELLYQGEPTTLTQSMAGRSFLLHSPQESNRRLLQRVLRLPQVSDGMIQGRSVRVILKKEATVDDIRQAQGMPEIEIEETAPRFEDAFIDLLGGAGTSESPLAAILHTVEGTPGETVIEAKSLTKKFGDFAATDNVNFAVKRGEIFGLLGPNGAGKSTTFKMMCKLIPYYFLGMLAMLLCMLVSVFILGVPYRGSLVVLFFITSLFLLSTLGMGLLISTITRNQFNAAQVALNAAFLPSIMLSGFIFQIDSMPAVIRTVTYVIPARYFVSTLQSLFLAGNIPVVLIVNTLFLMASAAMFIGLTWMKTKRRLD